MPVGRAVKAKTPGPHRSKSWPISPLLNYERSPSLVLPLNKSDGSVQAGNLSLTLSSPPARVKGSREPASSPRGPLLEDVGHIPSHRS